MPQEAHTAHPVNSKKEVESWSELHVGAWIAAINFGEFEVSGRVRASVGTYFD